MTELSQELTTFLRHLKTATEGVVDRAAIDEAWAALTGEPTAEQQAAADAKVAAQPTPPVDEPEHEDATVGAPAAAAEGGDGEEDA